ncbi:MAG: DUF134 domain-containing protein [bacterium]|nr:DUF134 domain-containing protein [bacterium]
MSRPPCCRRIAAGPAVAVFKPAGIPTCRLELVTMTLDEYEALRLADLEGQYHAEAATAMGVSRPTFGRILEAARRKVAAALTHGSALLIEGGPVTTGTQGGPRRHRCGRHCATKGQEP